MSESPLKSTIKSSPVKSERETLTNLASSMDCLNEIKALQEKCSNDLDPLLLNLLMKLNKEKSIQTPKSESLPPVFDVIKNEENLVPSIAKLTEVSFISPRGNFTVDFFKDKMILTSKDNKRFVIEYSDLKFTFNVPKAQATAKSLDRYLSLILKKGFVNGKNEIKILLLQPKLSLPATTNATEIKKSDNTLLPSQLEAFKYFLTTLAGQKISEPDKGIFNSTSSLSFVKAYIQTTKDGHLYPLSEGFLFLSPPVFVSRREVVSVVAKRSGTRTFDIELLKSDRTKTEFSMIDSEEQNCIAQYVAASKFNASLQSEDKEEKEEGGGGGGEEEDEDDEESSFELEDNSSSGSDTSSEDDDSDYSNGEPRCVIVSEHESDDDDEEEEERPSKKQRK